MNREISKARSYIYQWEEYARRFAEYVKLAEGDKTKAWVFFAKAYPDTGNFEGMQESFTGVSVAACYADEANALAAAVR